MKNYNPYEYCLHTGDINVNEVYVWSIDGKIYDGTLIDFIETMGEKRGYKIKCDDCGGYFWVQGRSIKRNGMLCKNCRSKRLALKKEKSAKIKRERSLAVLRPDILDYWSSKNKLKPELIYQNSQSPMAIFLICPMCGIEFEKTYASVLRTGAYCRSCVRRANVPKEKTLFYLYPEVAKWYDDSEKNNLSSKEVSASSNYEYWFKCPDCKGLYAKGLNNIIISYKKGHTGCPICAGYKVASGINDILTKNKPSAMYWDYDKNMEDPSTILYSDETMRWFKCDKGHSYQRTPFRMLKSYNKGVSELCPVCRGTEVIEGVNDVKTLNKWAYEQWDYEKNDVKPEEVYYKSDVAYWFKCSKGHSFKRAVSGMLRSYKGNTPYNGCTICQGKEVLSGFNDLKSLFPDIVDKYWSYEYNDVLPSEVSPFSGKEFWWKCAKCGTLFEQNADLRVRGLGYCPDCRKNKSISSKEIELYDFILDECPDAVSQFVLEGKSFDICVPSKKLLVEFNGLYYHSDAISKYGNKYCHLEKLQLAQKYGYSLYVIWEDDWDFKKEICLKGLYSRLGVLNERKINARDCIIVDMVKSCGISEGYHIQGNASIGCNYIGLKLGNEVVAELAYRIENNKLCIVRYASKYNVRGGFTKLLKRLETLQVDTIYTFSDNAVSEGKLYSNSGFELDSCLPPDYCYVYKGKRYHKFNFRKDRFKKDTNLQYAEGLTENELAVLNGLHRIWDYGKKKWVKIINTKK